MHTLLAITVAAIAGPTYHLTDPSGAILATYRAPIACQRALASYGNGDSYAATLAGYRCRNA